MPKLFDTVRLLNTLPEEGLLAGAIGVIVEEFTSPNEAYEVEFCDKNGVTIAQLALKENEFSVIAE